VYGWFTEGARWRRSKYACAFRRSPAGDLSEASPATRLTSASHHVSFVASIAATASPMQRHASSKSPSSEYAPALSRANRHARKERRLNLLLRLRHGPPPREPDDVSQAVLDLATLDWWYYAPDDEIEMTTNIHDGTQPICVEAIKEHQRKTRLLDHHCFRLAVLHALSRSPLPRVPPRVKRVTRR
jgi:hypothetical protein